MWLMALLLLPHVCRYEGPKSTNPLSFRYYNAEEVVAGKKMKDWCVLGQAAAVACNSCSSNSRSLQQP
jgi:xylose isomerase